jgi:hypothetical protein
MPKKWILSITFQMPKFLLYVEDVGRRAQKDGWVLAFRGGGSGHCVPFSYFKSSIDMQQ